MAPNDRPPAATPTLREDALQGLSVGLDILAAFADELPFPAAAIFSLAKNVIVNVEAVESNKEECSGLDDHTRQLLTVVLAAMKAKTDDIQEHYIPAELEENVKRFHESLQSIDKTVNHIHKVLHSERKRDKIRAFVSTGWYTSKLKKCTDDLNWAMELFKASVASQLETSLRICYVSQQIEAVAEQVEVVGTNIKVVGNDIKVVGAKVDSVSTRVEGVGTEVKFVGEEVQAVSGQVEGVSFQVDGVASQVADATAAVTGVSGDVKQVGTEVKSLRGKVEGVSGQVGNVRANIILESIPRSKRASSTCARPDRPQGCFEGTRTALLDLILGWIVDLDLKIPKCFWLKGLAGIGKTTVAYSVAKLARNRHLLVVDFFFSRLGDKELRDPTLVFPTLAYQLALLDPEFSHVITAALEAHPDAGYSSLKNQLDMLIVAPLSNVTPDPERIVVLVFDAFDECEAKGAKEILQLLVASLPFLPFFLKIFITSRPEEHIRSVLVPSNNLHITALHDIETSVVKEDIQLYLAARLRGLPRELGRDGFSEDWITQEQIKLLADAAGALFILAETFIRFLSEARHLRKRLSDLLLIINSSLLAAPQGHHKAFFYLDLTYKQILLGIIAPTNEEEITALFQSVVGSIVLLRHPLPLPALESLVNLDEGDADALLTCLYSVILPPGPPDYCPRIYHPSFPDFLLDHARCSDDRLWIDAKVHEPRLALSCLNIMNNSLHKNMLGHFDACLLNSEVVNLNERVAAACSPQLHYACEFWASHLAVVPQPADKRIEDELATFASRSLLPWFEMVSWLGKTRSAVRSLEAANAWTATLSSCSPVTVSLLKDGYRLLLAHFPTITESALHIARYVLPFVPRNVQLAATYADYADPNVKVVQGAGLQWSACIMTLIGHKDMVYTVAVSPDGTRIVSGSGDNTLRIWDASSGDLVAVLEGHTKNIIAVAFSPAGDRILSRSADQTGRLWDVTTGREVMKLEGGIGSEWISSVSFSSDGSRIGSGFGDTKIRIWDAVTGGILLTSEMDSDDGTSLVLFRDGELASGCTIRVSYLTGGIRIVTHSERVHAVAIFPDALQITPGVHASDAHSGSELRIDAWVVSRNSIETMQIWDASNSSRIETLEDPKSPVCTLALSPNGGVIASGTWDGSVRLWNTTTHEHTATYNGHTGDVSSVVFSHDGRRIVSASRDRTIKIWDASSIQGYEEGDQSKSQRVVSLAFSSDGTRLAVLYYGRTVEVRDPETGQIMLSFGLHQWIKAWSTRDRLWFSANGSQLFMASEMKNATLALDASNGSRIQPPYPKVDPQPEALFTLEGSKIVRRGASTDALVCILPSSIHATTIASIKLEGGVSHRIEVGCGDGRILALHVT